MEWRTKVPLCPTGLCPLWGRSPKRLVLQRFSAFYGLQRWPNHVDVFWSFDKSVTHTSITLFLQFSSECESEITEKWSKMLFLRHSCGLIWYYIMMSWPGYWQRCVSMPSHYFLINFWLIGQFLEKIYPKNCQKCHFNGKLRPFTASMCDQISALYFEM